MLACIEKERQGVNNAEDRVKKSDALALQLKQEAVGALSEISKLG